MIEFEYAKPNIGLTFKNVPQDGFFIDTEGYLCQKINSETFNMIATPKGIPNAFHCKLEKDQKDFDISKILEQPLKIKFT